MFSHALYHRFLEHGGELYIIVLEKAQGKLDQIHCSKGQNTLSSPHFQHFSTHHLP